MWIHMLRLTMAAVLLAAVGLLGCSSGDSGEVEIDVWFIDFSTVPAPLAPLVSLGTVYVDNATGYEFSVFAPNTDLGLIGPGHGSFVGASGLVTIDGNVIVDEFVLMRQVNDFRFHLGSIEVAPLFDALGAIPFRLTLIGLTPALLEVIVTFDIDSAGIVVLDNPFDVDLGSLFDQFVQVEWSCFCQVLSVEAVEVF